MLEDYSGAKENKIVESAGKWIEKENVIWSGVTKIQKDKHCIFFLWFQFPDP